jgi:hypothetical protein
MRQLGDFATWLGMILIIMGAICYAPKLVQYMSDDEPAKPTPFRIAARPSDWPSRGRHMVMRHERFDHRSPEHPSAN